MKSKQFLAALLCSAVLLSGCGAAAGSTTSSTGSAQDGDASSQPLSELEQLAQQTQAWENAGSYDDELAYREALLRVAELAREEDRGAYRCDDPSELSEDKLAALTDAAMRCHYAFGVYSDFDPFGEYIYATISLLIRYTPGTLEYSIFDNTHGYDGSLEPAYYATVKEADIQPFLDRTLRPLGDAFRAYSQDPSIWESWYWRDRGDGYLYVYLDPSHLYEENGISPFNATPYFTGIESLGGNRYLVTCDVVRDESASMSIFSHKLAMVVEDCALPDEAPYLSVLDCVSGEQSVQELTDIDPDEVERLRAEYSAAQADGSQEALELLERLAALSPIPYGTELAGQMPPAMEDALYDAFRADEEMTSGGAAFEDYVSAVEVHPTMHRYSETDQWIQSDPDQMIPYGEEWNMYPAAELEHALQRRFGIDLSANGRSWLNDRDFVPDEFSSGTPMAQFDGEHYIIYQRGRGGPGISPDDYTPSLIYHYDGSYTAVLWEKGTGSQGRMSSPPTIQLRNIGTEEEPFFQLLGYELPV